MRLDQYLKETRIIKRRTLSKQMCDEGFVFVNKKKAKASHEVKEEEEIEIFFKQKRTVYKVACIPKKGTSKVEAHKFYEVLDESYYEQ